MLKLRSIDEINQEILYFQKKDSIHFRHTWVDFYHEICIALLDYENKQDELVQMLFHFYNMNIPMQRRYVELRINPDKILDPFTFLGYFSRSISDDNRILMLSYICQKFNIKHPVFDKFADLPFVNNQNSGFFARRKTPDNDLEENKQDVLLLWKIFKKALKGTITLDDMHQTLLIHGIAIGKLSIGLYWCNPKKYLCIDVHTQQFILENKKTIKEEKDYIEILDYFSKEDIPFSYLDIVASAYLKDTF